MFEVKTVKPSDPETSAPENSAPESNQEDTVPFHASSSLQSKGANAIRHDWQAEEIQALYELPFNDLMLQAQQIHRQNFVANQVQVSTLLSIKTGACPEDCKYCPQSAHYDTDLKTEALMKVESVLAEAQAAKQAGATRFCMGAAWKNPRAKDMPYLLEMVKGVKEMGLETCMTLGMLSDDQADALSDAGLDYYNHNLDTSPDYYSQIITTRTYQDRLNTLSRVRNAGMKVCAGGIVGMGENQADRVGLLQQLANLPVHPESVPINMLVKVAGTPMDKVDDLDELTFIRTIAIARILMPQSHVRLSAGREAMSDTMQAWCFMAGANSIFYGDRLLTTENPAIDKDQALFARLGIRPEPSQEVSDEAHIAAINHAAQTAEQITQSDRLFYNAANS